MKKIVFALAAFVALSCSKEDSGQVIPDKVDGTLIKKAVFTENGQSVYYDYTFTADNHLQKIVASTGAGTFYYYTGDLVTRIDNIFGTLTTQKQFLYYDDQNRLTSLKRLEIDVITYSVTYTDNPDGTVTVKEFDGDYENGGSQITERTAHLENGNVTRIEKEASGGTLVTDYTYDDHPTQTSTILGFDKLRFYQSGASANANNMLSINSSAGLTELTYTYNAQGLPSTTEEADGGSKAQYYYY